MRLVCTCVAISLLAVSLHGCGNTPTPPPAPTLAPTPAPPTDPNEVCKSNPDDKRPAGVGIKATSYSGKVLGNITAQTPGDAVMQCLCQLDTPGGPGWQDRSKNSTRGLPMSITPLGTSEGSNQVVCTVFDYDAKPVPAPGSIAVVSQRLPMLPPKPSPIPCGGVGTLCIFMTVDSSSGMWTLAKQMVLRTSWHNAPPASFKTSTWFSVDISNMSLCQVAGSGFLVSYIAEGGASQINFEQVCVEPGATQQTIQYKNANITSGEYLDPDIFVLQIDSKVTDELGTESVQSKTMRRVVQRTRLGAHATMLRSTQHAPQASTVAII